MFDRILTIINNCTTENFDRQTVDHALSIYFGQGPLKSERFLIDTKNYSREQAIELVSSIEKENNRLNKQAVLINTIFLLLTLTCFIGSLLSYSYFFVFMFGLATVLWMIAWIKSFYRLWRGWKHPYVPGNSTGKGV